MVAAETGFLDVLISAISAAGVVGAVALPFLVRNSRKADKVEEQATRTAEAIGDQNGGGSVIEMLTDLRARLDHIEQQLGGPRR